MVIIQPGTESNRLRCGYFQTLFNVGKDIHSQNGLHQLLTSEDNDGRVHT